MADNTNNTSEEVDLGKLFQLIGKGISNLFKAIGGFFKSMLQLIIYSLLFLKQHYIVIGSLTIIGGVLGYYLQTKDGKEFQSQMILSTNFGSGHQLYNHINYLNNLISNQDYQKLSEIFNIDEKEIQTLVAFDVEPYEAKVNLLKEFDYYLKHTDSIYIKDLTIDDFKKRYSKTDHRYQLVSVFGKQKTLFPLLNSNFNKAIETQELKERLALKTQELNNSKSIYTKDLKEIDSLRAVYKKIDLLNATKNNTPNTSINLSGKKDVINKDIALFEETSSVLDEIKELNSEIVRNNHIVKNITQFSIGESSRRILSILWLKYALMGFVLSISIILGLKLNKYLDNYKSEQA